jgi:hypothetical protein
MRLKKMLRLLRDATEKQSHLYTPSELKYMNTQLQVIEEELLRLEHKNYKGFKKK